MSTATLVAVQKAILARARAAVAGGVGSPAVTVQVYDDVPENAPMPFVEIGRHQVAASNLLAGEQDIHTVTLAVWSDLRGQRQIMQVIDALRSTAGFADDAADLALDAGAVVSARIPRADTNMTVDGDQAFYVGTVTIELYVDRSS